MNADEAKRCVELLEAAVADRSRLAALPDDLRVALMTAAGRLSRPTRLELAKKAKAVRKVKRARSRAADREVRAASGIRQVRRASVYEAPGRAHAEAVGTLNKPRGCYVCHAPYRDVHFFYDSMCPSCAAFNYEKRFQTADLRGRTALVTGARVKIGYQAALLLLRAGAKVIVTTRFPHDAALRYAREKDFDSWSGRLQIHGLDLRHAPSVELLCRYLCQTEEGLEILINNAAQTVRRPPAYYSHLLANELRPAAQLDARARTLLSRHYDCVAGLAPALVAADGAAVETSLTQWSATSGRTGVGLRDSARLSQLPYAYDEEDCPPEVFPSGRTDADLQQIDLRARNTWRLTLGEVATPEMLEVHLINAVAPFILCGKLRPLMLRRRFSGKHIVNVSAMEGSFSRRTKTDKHPHTNMAKAALNMMTLTSAPDYARDGIHMNAVDTGWVTDEDPAVHSERKRVELDFEPPLDIVDGAARVVDPVFSGLRTGEHACGKFFKDYRPTDW